MKRVFQKTWDYIVRVDKLLWCSCIAIAVTSAFLIYGILQTYYVNLLQISGRNFVVQVVAIGGGILVALILSLIDYQNFERLWVIHVPLTYLLTILTFFIGVAAPARPNAKRWLDIPIVNVWFQPAEVLKISFILVMAYHIAKLKDHINNPLAVLSLLAHTAIPVALVHFQGDDGTALLILFIGLSMIFMAGIGWRYILPGIGAAVALLPVIWNVVLSEFQRERIMFLFEADPDPLGDYYQQYQSMISIGIGQMTGMGLMSEEHHYVPEIHTDFIFAFFCESFGFIGAFLLIAIVVALCVKLLINAFRAPDTFSGQICVGVFGMFFFQIVINIGMCLSLLPVVGNTFPFLSYGGSSMVTNFLGLGLALSASMKQKKNLFSSG